VGGAVRDKLLGYPCSERDWVVVGGTPDALAARGFRPVGKDFPVFIDPKTGEEYALARTERKTGPGYKGFQFHADQAVTLAEDLLRRDLSINAMAEAADGRLIDPHGGLADLEARTLRHVSPAFAEDPLRVLRVARFAARYHHLGFTVADETLALMSQLSASGELEHLVPERVWLETEKALSERSPQVFVQVLKDCGALQVLFPEVDQLFGIPQRADYHPEIDTGIHLLMSLERAAMLSDDTRVRFAVLVHDLGKGSTSPDILPRHIGHEERGIPLVQAFCDRFRVPNNYRELALPVTRLHLLCHKTFELRPLTILKIFKSLDAFRHPDRLDPFLFACEADARGRLHFEDRDYPQSRWLRQAFESIRTVTAGEFIDRGLTGQRIGEAIDRRRVELIAELRQADGH